jgi:folylpolyglutamate synthase/dihydropteroate synthase
MERSADPAALAQGFAGRMKARSHSESRAALRLLIAESAPDDVIVVAGSLYLLGEVRPMLQEFAAAQGKVDG